ncbi:hypothetical protein ABE937_15460 [Enterococcus casseliflavus]|uniref:hypothetical protein n=1 Tax=Enterococcus casseliflavus TaxID=37734 RepID=UPI003D6A4347
MVKNVQVGKIYCCRIPGIEEAFDVVVLRKINRNEFLVKAINYNEEQNRILREFRYVFTVEKLYLSDPLIGEEFKVEIGKIYICQLPSLKGPVDVEVLKVNRNRRYLVRLIRCTKSQREQLGDNYSSRFIVPGHRIIGISEAFM